MFRRLVGRAADALLNVVEWMLDLAAEQAEPSPQPNGRYSRSHRVPVGVVTHSTWIGVAPGQPVASFVVLADERINSPGGEA